MQPALLDPPAHLHQHIRMIQDEDRKQQVYLYHVASGKTAPLGGFYLPPKYEGEWRCDTHRRCSPHGRSVVIDSPHGGDGRQMYLIDTSQAVQSSL